MKDKHQYQFELWEECNSRCRFCYLGKSNNKTDDNIKIKNLQRVIDKINNREFLKNINCLGYIGGEFFQGQLKNEEVKRLFMEVMKITNKLIQDKFIDEVWISATLTIGDQKDLYQALSNFQDLSKVWILTSYDTIGRFHTEKMKDDWLNNLRQLREYSQELNINITSILTGDFIDRYINDTLEIKKIAEQHNCSMFWKPTCSIDRQDDNHKDKQQVNNEIPNFFPTRKRFLEFLYKYKTLENNFLYDKLFNMQYRSEYLEKFSKGFNISHRLKESSVEVTDDESSILSCGHSSQYQIYVDSEECAICDKNRIRNLI